MYSINRVVKKCTALLLISMIFISSFLLTTKKVYADSVYSRISYSFEDMDSESGNNGSFFTDVLTSKKIQTSDIAKSGEKSFDLKGPEQTVRKDISGTDKSVSVWIYDDVLQSDWVTEYIALYYEYNGTTYSNMLGISTVSSKSYYYQRDTGNSKGSVSSGVQRTDGWHKISFDVSSRYGTSLYIDNKFIYNCPNATSFSRFEILDVWNYSSYGETDAKVYYDDLMVTDISDVYWYSFEDADSAGITYFDKKTYEKGTDFNVSEVSRNGTKSISLLAGKTITREYENPLENKTVTINMYDEVPELFAGQYHAQYLYLQSGTKELMLGLSSRFLSGDCYIYRDTSSTESTDTTYTKIKRTKTWHMLSARIEESGISLFIDGELVYKCVNMTSVDKVSLHCRSESISGGAYFDDIEITDNTDNFTVTEFYPSYNASNVDCDSPLKVTFSSVPDLSYIDNNIILQNESGKNVLFDYNLVGNTLVITSRYSLSPKEYYTLSVLPGIFDVNGKNISSHIKKTFFKTGGIIDVDYVKKSDLSAVDNETTVTGDVLARVTALDNCDFSGIFAVYDNTNRLVDIDFVPLNAKENNTYDFEVNIPSSQNKHILKFFAFESMDTLKPFYKNGNLMETAPENVELFVAPDGKSDASGTIDDPIDSIENCVNRLTELRDKNEYILPDGDYNIYLRGGEYNIEKTNNIRNLDYDRKLTVSAYKNEKPVLNGGKTIDCSNPLDISSSNSVDSRILDSVKDKILKIDLKAQGITDYGVLEPYGMGASNLPQYTDSGTTPQYPIEIFCGNTMMSLARYPNNDEYMLTGEVADEGSVIRNWLDDAIGSDSYVPPEEREDPPVGPEFKYTDERVSGWSNIDDIWLYGFWKYDWADQTVKVDSIDVETGTIICETPSVYGVKASQRFYAFNIIEELDCEGEYYIDRDNGILYFYPPENYDGNLKMASSENSILYLNELNNVEINGITFENAKNTAVTGFNLNNVRFENCTFRYCGTYGCKITNSKNTGFNDCYIHSMGRSGISIIGGGNSSQLESSGNYITECYMHTMGLKQKAFVYAYEIPSTGAYVANNEIHSLPFGAGTLSIKTVTENNQIYDVCNTVDDCGAIGAGRSFLQARGAQIRNNLIYDVTGLKNKGSLGVRAVMLDDSLSGVTIEDNIFYNVASVVSLNGGRDNTIKNNIIHTAGLYDKPTIGINDHTNDSDNYFYQLLNELNNSTEWKNDVWQKEFPTLKTLLENEEYKSPGGNDISDNFLISSALLKYPDGFDEISNVSANSEYPTGNVSWFKNEKFRDFSLTDQNSLTNVNSDFENIDTDAIGISYRKLIRDCVVMKVGTPYMMYGNATLYLNGEYGDDISYLQDGKLYVPSKALYVLKGDKSEYAQYLSEDEFAGLLGMNCFKFDNGLVIFSHNDMSDVVDEFKADKILRFFDNPYVVNGTYNYSFEDIETGALSESEFAHNLIYKYTLNTGAVARTGEKSLNLQAPLQQLTHKGVYTDKSISVWMYDSQDTNRYITDSFGLSYKKLVYNSENEPEYIDRTVFMGINSLNKLYGLTGYYYRDDGSEDTELSGGKWKFFRAKGWHELRFDVSSKNGTSMYLDGNFLVTCPDVKTITEIKIYDGYDYSPYNETDSDIYFDDITIKTLYE